MKLTEDTRSFTTWHMENGAEVVECLFRPVLIKASKSEASHIP